jgi:hypothetical protein
MARKAKGGMIVEMDADEHKLFRKQQKLMQQQKQMATGYGQVGRASERASDKAAKGFGSKATAGMQSYAASLVSATALIGTATAALSAMNQAADQAAQKMLDSEMQLARLSELSGGSAFKLGKLKSLAAETFLEGGAGGLGEAAQTIYQLESAGKMEFRKLISDLYGTLGDPAEMVKFATAFQTTIGKAETGTVRDIISKALGANPSAPAEAPMLLTAANRAAAPAKMLGLTDEEVLAAATVLTKAKGTPEQAATQLESLLTALVTQVDDKGKSVFKGLTLPAMLKKLEGMDKTESEMVKYLGRKEALAGSILLTANLEELAKVKREIITAQETDLVGRIIRARRLDPELSAMANVRRSAAELEMSTRGPLGIARLEGDAFINRESARSRTEGRSELFIWVKENVLRANRWLASDEYLVRNFGRQEEKLRFDLVTRAARKGVPLDVMGERMLEEGRESLRGQIAETGRRPSANEVAAESRAELEALQTALRTLPGKIAAAIREVLRENRSPTLGAANYDVPHNAKLAGE